MTQKTDEWMLKADDRGHFNIKIQMDGTWIHEAIRSSATSWSSCLPAFYIVMKMDSMARNPGRKGSDRCRGCASIHTGINIENQGEPDTQSIHVSTSTGDACILGAENPLSMTPAPDGELLPTVVIRDGLAGLFNRATYYDLMDLVTEGPAPNHRLGIGARAFSLSLKPT